MQGNAGIRLEHVIARNVAEERRRRGWSQATLAAVMTDQGFPWSPNRAHEIEALRRTLALPEVISLAWVFEVGVDRLMAGDDLVAMPDGSTVPLGHIREALDGSGQSHRRVAAARRSAELHKLAAKLEVPVRVVDWLSAEMFDQRSFADERERRAGDLSGVAAGTARAKRAHASRAMLGEMHAYLDGRRDDVIASYNLAVKAQLTALAPRTKIADLVEED